MGFPVDEDLTAATGVLPTNLVTKRAISPMRTTRLRSNFMLVLP